MSTALDQLCDMGFPREKCSQALSVCKGDPQSAIEWLLVHGSEPTQQQTQDLGHYSGLFTQGSVPIPRGTAPYATVNPYTAASTVPQNLNGPTSVTQQMYSGQMNMVGGAPPTTYAQTMGMGRSANPYSLGPQNGGPPNLYAPGANSGTQNGGSPNPYALGANPGLQSGNRNPYAPQNGTPSYAPPTGNIANSSVHGPQSASNVSNNVNPYALKPQNASNPYALGAQNSSSSANPYALGAQNSSNSVNPYALGAQNSVNSTGSSMVSVNPYNPGPRDTSSSPYLVPLGSAEQSQSPPPSFSQSFVPLKPMTTSTPSASPSSSVLSLALSSAPLSVPSASSILSPAKKHSPSTSPDSRLLYQRPRSESKGSTGSTSDIPRRVSSASLVSSPASPTPVTKLDFLQLKIKKLQERQRQEDIQQSIQQKEREREKEQADLFSDYFSASFSPPPIQTPYKSSSQMKLTEEKGLLLPNLKGGLNFVSPIKKSEKDSEVPSPSVFDPKDISEVDSHFKQFITDNPMDCYEVLLGQCSIVLISNHPIGMQCSFLRTWADPYARVEQPSEQLIQHVADTIDDVYQKTRNIFLGYYTFLKDDNEMIDRAIYESILEIIYPSFFSLIKKSVKDRDADWQLFMERVGTKLSPKDLGLPQQFWLEKSPNPYSSSISLLSQITKRKSMHSKFECIVGAGTQIVSDINEYHAQYSNKQITVTADELLPLMAFVLIKANIPNIHAETKYLDMLSASQTGREAYMLATLSTAIDVAKNTRLGPGAASTTLL
eukprot:TRINITY_DN1398_c0_g1_i2.p1 TRINITY_DN1398_c0_g1~~TRINITY_DN1398_c0_g1_i2.p1  ORF type:complete len:774 (-),score=111.46 TRINITY_DN1398_c0_g1_i2:1053-3374(-)